MFCKAKTLICSTEPMLRAAAVGLKIVGVRSELHDIKAIAFPRRPRRRLPRVVDAKSPMHSSSNGLLMRIGPSHRFNGSVRSVTDKGRNFM
jgi:hypothetical protein